MRPPFLVLAAAAATAATLHAQPPPSYYTSVVATTPALLRSTLHAVIDDHVRIPYTASSTDTWNVLELADQAPGSTTHILDLYKNALYAKQGGGTGPYNREHTWPNSYGFPVDGGTNYPYTDCHHLFLCDTAYNGARANNPFLTAQASWTEYTTQVNAGQGGGSGVFPGNSNWGSSVAPIGGWQTWAGRKGDVARAIFYMDVRYEGGTHGTTGAAEPDLRLTDNLGLVQASATGSNESIAYMGALATLLLWHQQDPVDAKELAHTNAVFTFQGNRNPFVDHPEWVGCLWQNQCARVRVPEVWINELHYDNNGVDLNEFVEVAGPAGDNVDGWLLVAVDGATGAFYARRHLTGVFPNQQNGVGTLAFPFPGLQDGAPDGIALITADGVVMQFLGYEGAFTGNGGLLTGRTATDIGVSELPTSAPGLSLQLGGTGNRYTQFGWQSSLVATPGARNTNQVFQ
jgi:endonuclease I